MRVAPDARSYARTVAAGKPHEEQIAKAFHDGMLHERARMKKLANLAATNAPTPVDRRRAMTDAPKPDTTLSAEDLALFRAADKAAKDGVLGERVRQLVRIVRDLDARLALSLANERGAEYEIREVQAENAALTERLRVAEEHAAAIESRMAALNPVVVHEKGTNEVLLHHFDVMVAFFGDKAKPHRWDDLRGTLAPEFAARVNRESVERFEKKKEATDAE